MMDLARRVPTCLLQQGSEVFLEEVFLEVFPEVFLEVFLEVAQDLLDLETFLH